MKIMRILLYNWVPYDDEENRGGGVRVYQSNLIRELKKLQGVQVYTLSSGIIYNLWKRGIYIRKRSVKNGVKSYEVVNSPITAPAHTVFYSLDIYLKDKTLGCVIKEFIDTHGPFDIIQFDNLEGLSAEILTLKKDFPSTNFIFNMHNYNLFCPQVNLWFGECELCIEYNDGKKCSVCLSHNYSIREVKIAHGISTFLKSLHLKHSSFFFRVVFLSMHLSRSWSRAFLRKVEAIRLRGRIVASPGQKETGSVKIRNMVYSNLSVGEVYRKYRETNVLNMNKHIDHVIAVSKRVKEIAVSYGISRNKVSVYYIGTEFARQSVPIRVLDREGFKIAYLGYERADKGFYHFVEALETIPCSDAKRISVLIAAKLQSNDTLNRLKRLSVKFLEFHIVDGYEHKTLKLLLEDVDLGVVPVLWEDNLPHVALEFVAHGVPVLSSDLGGAKELCGGSRSFVYRHGNVNDFINKILFFLNNRYELQRYEKNRLKLINMEKHVNVLLYTVFKK